MPMPCYSPPLPPSSKGRQLVGDQETEMRELKANRDGIEAARHFPHRLETFSIVLFSFVFAMRTGMR